MKHLLKIAVIAALCTQSTVLLAEDAKAEETKSGKKPAKSLQALLKSLKVKGDKAKTVKHEVAVPVASAGVRASGAKTAQPFAVVWPDKKISPLTALAMNLSNAAAQGKPATDMKKQISDFQENFPEHREDPLLKDLSALLAQE